ncbi:MAG: SdpI family protein [Bacteroidetes bacterium]|nr:SdpI family protein [Bacteroidota bacterium]
MKTIFTKPFELVLLALSLAPLIFMAVTWGSYPEKVPVHWGPDGQVDRMGSPATFWVFACIGLAAYPLLLLIPKIDPKRKQLAADDKGFGSLRLVLHLFFAALPVVAALAALGTVTDIPRIITIMVLLLFLGLGNYMTVVKPNYFAGIRTPWTLSNDEVWRKTHRLGGRVWVIMALIMLPLVFLLPAEAMFITFISGILLSTAGVVVYSYLLWKKLSKTPTQQ